MLSLQMCFCDHHFSFSRPLFQSKLTKKKIINDLLSAGKTGTSNENIEINKITDEVVHYQLVDSNSENSKSDKPSDVNVAIKRSETTFAGGSNRNTPGDLLVGYRWNDGRVINSVKVGGQKKANESDLCSAEVNSSKPRENDIGVYIQTPNDDGKESNRKRPRGSTLASQEEPDKSDDSASGGSSEYDFGSDVKLCQLDKNSTRY